MIRVTRKKPDGTPLAWLDTTLRLAYDETPGSFGVRPFTAAENTYVDGLDGEEQVTAAEKTLRQQLEQGIANIQAARDAAENDIVTAQNAHAAALDVQSAAQAQRDGVAAFVPAATYSQAQMTAVKNALLAILDRQGLIIQAIAANLGWRVAVDENAVTTDNALLWLAQLASGAIDENGN
jgi:hypothetical protein